MELMTAQSIVESRFWNARRGEELVIYNARVGA
jgi:hypothetical protein